MMRESMQTQQYSYWIYRIRKYRRDREKSQNNRSRPNWLIIVGNGYWRFAWLVVVRCIWLL